jgi:hypothetical protein
VKNILIGLVLAAAIVASATAQETPAKVLRAVYFTPAQSGGVLDKEGQALVRGAPEMLATTIATLQPFNRAESAATARSVVSVIASPATAGKVSVRIQLLESGTVKSQSVREISAMPLDFVAFQTLINDTAARFAPFLGPVDPETDVLKVTAQQQVVRAAQEETDYLTQLDKRLEFTLWLSGLLRLLDSTGMDTSARTFSFGLDLLPLTLEADWFFSRYLGLQFSFFFNDSNAYDFGKDSRHNAYGLFLFPGVGLIYRTLGEISAEFAITLSVGWIYLTAKSGDVVDRDGVVELAQGKSTWSKLAGRVRLSPAVVWTLTPSVALKGALGIDLIIPGMFSWYDSPLGDLQFLTIGVAYRL